MVPSEWAINDHHNYSNYNNVNNKTQITNFRGSFLPLMKGIRVGRSSNYCNCNWEKEIGLLFLSTIGLLLYCILLKETIGLLFLSSKKT